MQPKHGLVDRRGHDTSMTRETVEEMIAAALSRAALYPRTAARTENDKGRLDQYQTKIVVLEHQRDEALGKITALENERDEALKSNKVLSDEHAEDLVTIRALEYKVNELRSEVTLVDNQSEAIWDEANAQIDFKQKEFNDMLATKEAKIAHLESQLAKIHSLSKSDETVVLTPARPDSASTDDRTDRRVGDHWGKDTSGTADYW
ncbi:uncharacterized protein B0J16DRAFT_386959 [Fusarium flagelliforme]|uniref:uncharacterized protein n=1 Tax=Fusarium flagelliforme TaxID=2675880 RepID=UPI001E8E3B70|nr:uncharacterized protein B0J16DRAFT_386959 [Fusarium flagelliforme]KAH7179135.1 hypothetical protein B0J16DRAFT_386959 [Fusarium flagelliforme]